MTKVVLLFVFVFTFFRGCPQGYYKMLGAVNSWYVSGELDLVGISSHNRTGPALGVACLGKYIANDDSIVAGKTYKVFKRVTNLCPFEMAFSKCLIREDTVLRKIFFIREDSVIERVVLDFSLSVGDSI